MRKKKDLPLIVLKALQPFVNLKGERFETIEPDKNLLYVVDQDIDSNFYFIIEQFQKQKNGKFQFLMSKSPSSQTDISIQRTWVDIDQLQSQFNNWIKLLEEYENVTSFFDDPIVNSFKDEFFAEFEIIDDDADISPLNTNQILLLENHLNEIKSKLEDYKNDTNTNEINNIQDDIILLKENLTRKSKKWVIKNLSRIWGKIAKQGTTFIKDFLSQSKKEIIKQGVKGLIEIVKDNGLDLLP